MKILPVQFDGHTIRRVFDDDSETWWFSVIDIVQVLTSSANARDYWFKMKLRVRTDEGGELSTVCRQLKIPATDGKQRLTDVATAQGLLRIIQSIPSPKAEPVKLWLAKVGYERMQELADPVRAVDRARETWKKHGRSEKWIQQRMTGQETRNKLTDYWANHEVTKPSEFSVLTNIIHQEWSGLSVKSHKSLKGLADHNLRDHMNEAELIFTALAEMSTRQIAETEKAIGLQSNKVAATKGGGISKSARMALETQTRKDIVTGENFLAESLESPSPKKRKLRLPIDSAQNVASKQSVRKAKTKI
jgi:DNA-damage-inducible protein D